MLCKNIGFAPTRSRGLLLTILSRAARPLPMPKLSAKLYFNSFGGMWISTAVPADNHLPTEMKKFF